MNGLQLLSRIFIWTSPIYFAVTKWPSATSIYLYVSTNVPVIKYEISCVMWKVTPESKIKLVSCELSPKYFRGLSVLDDILAIDVCIFCDVLLSILLSNVLSSLNDLYAQVLGFSVFQGIFFTEVSCFRPFAMNWSSDPHLKHVFSFWLWHPVHLLLEICELKDY